MKRILHFVVLSLVVVALAGCAKSGPVTLSLASSQSRSGEIRMEADSAFQEPAPLPVEVKYAVRGTLPYLGDRLLAWSIGRRTKPSGELDKLAFSFGIEGEVEKVDDNMYLVTDASKQKSVNLWVDDAGGWWSYRYFPTETGSGSSGSTPPCNPDGPCEIIAPDETPVTSLIEPGDALRRTNQYLSRADMVPLNYPLKARKTDFSTEVYGALTLGGVETNIGVSFSYGEDGVLLAASGPMITIAMAGRYPIVSPMEAVKRLSNPLYGAIGNATRIATDVAVQSPGDMSDSSTGVPNPASSDASVDVVVSGVRLVLMEARLSNGTHMLLPAYTYSNEDGDVGTVIAITDDLIAFRKSVTESTAVSPSPTDGGEVVPEPAPQISQAEADSLIGLTESEAVKTAQSKGWTVRIAARDGEYFMLTSDYITNRVNLVVEKTLVTSVAVG